MLKIAVGHSEDVDTLRAVETVIAQCRHQLGHLEPQAGIVFAGIEYEHRKILTAIRARYPGIELVGCTTAGEISSISGNSDDSDGLVLIYSDTLEIKSGVGRNMSEDPAAAIRFALAHAKDRRSRTPSLCLIFPDSYNPSFQAIVDSLNTELGSACPVFGGGAGTLEAEKAPLQFYGDEVLQNALPLLLFFGDLELEFNVNNSWRPLGMRARVTEVSGTTVRLIGDMKALDFYRYYVGPHGHPAAEFPLAVFDDIDENQFYVRAPMDFDEDSGSVSFAGPIPLGATVQLTEATREQMVAYTQAAIGSAFKQITQTWRPAAALVFSCITRKAILGTRTPEELQILRDHLPADVPIMGFYSFGEFGPLQKNQLSRMHSSTMVTLLLGEKDSRPDAATIADQPPASEPVGPKADDQTTLAQLQNENLYLKRKLKRSEGYRQRLETTVDLNASVVKKINRDINRARLEIEHKNELLRQTLELADEIQKNMLPRRNPQVANFQIAGKSVYCSETGGDYFDFLKTDKDRPGPFSVLVGDVTGHGIEAALLMTTARALIRSRALQPGSVAQILTEVNQHLAYDIGATGRFMTMFYLTIDPGKKCLNWVRAGHDPAIFYDPATDTFEELGGGSGIPLGVDESFAYEANEKSGLAKDHIIFIGTDGIWETHNPKGEMLGKEPVLDIIRKNASNSPQTIIDNVIAVMNDFREDREPEDDATLVAVKVESEL
jgi:serine phosphatase RsbU (regulator of sigma subunit)